MKLKSWHIALSGSVLQLAVILYAIVQYKAGAADAFMFLTVPLIGAAFTKMLRSDRSRKFGALFAAVPSAIFLVALSAYAKDIVLYVPLVPALLAAGLFYFWKERIINSAKTAPAAAGRTGAEPDSDSPEDAAEAQARKELGIDEAEAQQSQGSL